MVLNGQVGGSVPITSDGKNEAYVKGQEVYFTVQYAYKSGDKLSVKLEYNKQEKPSVDGYVDYIRLNVKRQLKT